MSETIKTREQLKQIFVTGAVPTQQDFHDLFDAMAHKSEINPDSEAVTPFEQFFMAQYYQSEEISNGVFKPVLNTKRLPVEISPLIGTLSQTEQDQSGSYGGDISARSILYHRGRFYDTGFAGARAHLFATIPVTPNSAKEDQYYSIEIDNNTYYIIFNPSASSEEDSCNFLLATGSTGRTITIEGYSITLTVDETQGETSLEIEAEEIGYHSIAVGDGSSYLQLFSEDDSSWDKYTFKYGVDELQGYPVEHSASGSYKVFFRLTNQLNPITAALGYYQAEAICCLEEELAPGTYYYSDGNSGNILTEIVVEQPAE